MSCGDSCLKKKKFTMKTITLARYLTTDITYILDVRGFVSWSTFQMPKLGYFSCGHRI